MSGMSFVTEVRLLANLGTSVLILHHRGKAPHVIGAVRRFSERRYCV